MSKKLKAAFIDRDGVINEERNYVYQVEDFVLLPGVVQGLSILREAGYLLIIVTNQAGIARGYYNHSSVDTLHEHMFDQLAQQGVFLDAVYFCPHHPHGKIKKLAFQCECRKPSPGMLNAAALEFNLDLSASVLIGDKFTDIQAGKRAGVGKNIIVESGHYLEQEARLQADLIAKDLLAAARNVTI